jgi:uncharacterized protein (DUF1697 family)
MRYALLLRGVNVGTKNALPMADLRAMLARLGCTDVATYIQSGNAVLSTALTRPALLAAAEAALAAYMGRPIAVTVRTAAELARVVAANPFPAAEPSRLCVYFLSKPASPALLRPLAVRDFAPERFHPAGAEIYAWYPAGQGKSALAAALGAIELPGCVTARNWNTVLKLHALIEA